MLFLPIQQELDCISDDGRILGRIRFDAASGKHQFQPDNGTTVLTEPEQACVDQRLSALDCGDLAIPMQDDD